jgi:hypothetical protein
VRIGKKANKAAALHIAGNDDPEYALVISPRVLDALQVDIWRDSS